MASASSSAARSLIRDGKSVANLLLRGHTANLTKTVQSNGPAIQSLLRFNQTPASQYPVFFETFSAMQSGFRVGIVQKEAVPARIGEMEAAHGKRVVDNEDDDVDSEEEETDFDEEEIDVDDIDDDEEFEDMDEDDDEEEDEEDKYTRKKK